MVPFLKVVNDTAVAVNQGGKRKGAVCAYLESWHLDIEEFLELRKNTGDDRRRTHDMNTANWIPDLFMRRVMESGDWTLFSPSTCPDLHDKFGTEFEKAYIAYEEKAARGEIKLVQDDAGHRPVAQDADDAVRDRASLDHLQGRLQRALAAAARRRGALVATCAPRSRSTPATPRSRSATSARSTWLQHLKDGAIDHDKLKKTIATAMRMLDNVIDINYYAVKKARDSNLRHRPVGLGMMGFQDALYELRIPYASRAGGRVRRPLDGSRLLPRLLGLDRAGRASAAATPATRGSLWDKGILPLDTLDLLAEGSAAATSTSTARPRWTGTRCAQQIAEHGMRNSNCVAIAPTATISNIIGVDASIEPCFGNLSVKSNLSGEFTVINDYLVRDLKRLGLWDDVMVMDLKHFDGSLRPHRPRAAGREGALRHRVRGRDRSGWWRPRRAARSGSTRRSRSTSTWPAPRARSSTRPTSWPGCAA